MAETPFLKQLVASDRKTRDDALQSLKKYLTSGRDFSDLELLKLWRGLFFCMWHSDRPLPQQRLATSLSTILYDLPPPLFIPFLRAFWLTMAREWSSIDALRLDKFLRLVRSMVHSTFTYLKRQAWRDDLLSPYLAWMETSLVGSFGGTNVKVPDGLKYHIIDVWVDELDKVDGGSEVADKTGAFMAPLKAAEAKGSTKTLRGRAREALEDERLKDWRARNEKSSGGSEAGSEDRKEGDEVAEDEEWGGIED